MFIIYMWRTIFEFLMIEYANRKKKKQAMNF